MHDATVETVTAYESGYAAAKAEMASLRSELRTVKAALVETRQQNDKMRPVVESAIKMKGGKEFEDDPMLLPYSEYVEFCNAVNAFLDICPACGAGQYSNYSCPTCQQHHKQDYKPRDDRDLDILIDQIVFNEEREVDDIPRYSSDEKAAHDLITKMAPRYRFSYNGSVTPTLCGAVFLERSGRDPDCNGYGPTREIAICRAALAVKRMEAELA